jgi:two-component system, NarL family, response regulator NreC
MGSRLPDEPYKLPTVDPVDRHSVQSLRQSHPRVRIGLVDDHHLVREGLRLVLSGEAGFEVVGEAATHAEAFDLVATTRPDVLVLDLTFPEGDGLPLLRALRALHPDLRIVVLTMDRGSETVRQALVTGAQGYIVKGAHSKELIEAIEAVSRGERYLHSSVAGAIVDDAIRFNRAGSQLSLREREILSLLGSGRSTREVSEMLGISIHTVRRHVANLSDKLGLHGVAALTRYAVEHGLIRSR